MTDSRPHDIDRRSVLHGLGLAGAAVTSVGLLAGCGADEGASGDAAAEGGSSALETPDESGRDGGQTEVLTATADVPKGGGVILEDAEVVVTQPAAGEFVAFSSICTHQGCPVSDVAGGTINCPCHGSQFSIEDGSVVAGPAASPLPAVEVTVDGDSVVRA